MQNIPTLAEIKGMSDEEVAAMNRKIQRQVILNVAIFVGVKVAIIYTVHRLAKRAAKM